MKPLVLIVALSLGASAVASPKQIAMPIGHTTTVSMPSSVVKVKVDDPSLVEVKKDGRKVTFLGRTKGATDAVVTTVDGETKLHIYIASDRFGLP